MNRAEIMEQVTAIFRKVLRNNSIVLTDATTAADIRGWDSLTHLMLVSMIEEAFGTKFSIREVTEMKNVGELVDVLEQHKSGVDQA